MRGLLWVLLIGCGASCPAELSREGGACVGDGVELGRASIGPAGGTLRAGAFRLEVPPGALSETVDFTLSAIESGDEVVVPGSSVRIEPAGTTFAIDARLFVRFDGTSTGVELEEEEDFLAHLDGVPPEELEGRAVDLAASEISADVPHLSAFGVWRRRECRRMDGTWCRPRGCVDLLSDPLHCGACDVACAPGAMCIAGGCEAGDAGMRDAGMDAGMSDAGRDAGRDAGSDGGGDAGSDAGPPMACEMGAPGIATRRELIAGLYNNPQVATDPGGAIMYWGDVRAERFDASGAHLATQLLPASGIPDGIVRAGSVHYELYHDATSTYVRRLNADGTVGAPILVGAGRAVEGGIAYRARSDELAVLRIDAGNLVASVFAPAGAPSDTIIAPDADFLVMASIAAHEELGTRRFTVAYGEDSGLGFTAMARPIPLDTAVMLSAAGAMTRTALHAITTSDPGVVAVVWLETDGAHGATLSHLGALTSLPLLLAQPSGGSILRVSASPSAAPSAFDLVADQVIAGAREVVVRSFDALGSPMTALERVSPICSGSFSEGRISVVRGSAARYAAWTDMGIGHIVCATF